MTSGGADGTELQQSSCCDHCGLHVRLRPDAISTSRERQPVNPVGVCAGARWSLTDDGGHGIPQNAWLAQSEIFEVHPLPMPSPRHCQSFLARLGVRTRTLGSCAPHDTLNDTIKALPCTAHPVIYCCLCFCYLKNILFCYWFTRVLCFVITI